MNIALVFPPFYFEPMYNMPPLGLINLGTALKKTNHIINILDFPLSIRLNKLHMDKNIYKECARQILQFEPDIAGFSVQCTTYPPAIRIAEEVKKLKPRVSIVFGGHNASFVDELTLARYPFIDVVVRGEGEITFSELIQAFDRRIPLTSIDGMTFRAEGRIIRNPDRDLIENLDSLPESDYSLVPPFHVYRDVCGIRRSIAILEVGRGCQHHCVYCSQSLIWRRKARTFSTGRLICEMKDLTENFGAECFLLAYDQFTARRDFVEDFCHGVVSAGLNRIPWYCISRLDTLDRPLLNLMREAGCETMCYGIDSGSKRTLAFIRKSIDSEILFKRVLDTTEAGIIPTLSFVIGLPEETREDLEETLKLALKSAITGNANILVQMATILPGTDLYKKYGHNLVREVDTYFSLGIEFDRGRRIPSDDELIDSDPAIFSSFYNLPCPAGPLSELNEIASYFTIIASLYPRSFLLLSLELDRPVADLFFDFLNRACVIKGDINQTRRLSPCPAEAKYLRRPLTPQACLINFGDFVMDSLARKGTPLTREYIIEVVKYETCLLRAGEPGSPPSPFQIDPARIKDLKPFRSEKIMTEMFTFDVPRLIFEHKNGHFPEEGPRRAVFLVFIQSEGKAQALEINEFGFDFLRLSDGQSSLEQIAEQLYPKYGAEKNREEFAVMCAEAAGTLAELRLIAPL